MSLSEHIPHLRKLLQELPTPLDPALGPDESLAIEEALEEDAIQGYAREYGLDATDLKVIYSRAMETLFA